MAYNIDNIIVENSLISSGDTTVYGNLIANNAVFTTFSAVTQSNTNQNVQSLTANTSNINTLFVGQLSATTYLGLPVTTDYYVTGATYTTATSPGFGTLTLTRQNGTVTVTNINEAFGTRGAVQFKSANTTGAFTSSSLFNYNVQGGGGVDNEWLTIGPAGSNLAHNPLSVNSTGNFFVQSNVQNTSNGGSASSDMVATADNGNDNTNYVDLGINSSGYNDPAFTIGGPNDSYLYAAGGSLSIGTDSAQDIVFHTNGTLLSNEVLRIKDNGSIVQGISGLTTNATNGFFYLNSVNGTPTGIPTSFINRIPMVFDRANNLFYYYSNGSWRTQSTPNILTGLTVNGDMVITGSTTTNSLSAATITGTSVVFNNVRITNTPVAGYIFTADANGNGTWQPSPTPSSGSTRLDMQTATGTTTVTSTNNSSTWVDIGSMTITTRNLGSSATTYTLMFSCTAALSTNTGSANFRMVLNGVAIPSSNRQITNNGNQAPGTSRSVAINTSVTNIKNGDILRVQFNSPTGQLTVTDRAFSIIGILNVNLV